MLHQNVNATRNSMNSKGREPGEVIHSYPTPYQSSWPQKWVLCIDIPNPHFWILFYFHLLSVGFYMQFSFLLISLLYSPNTCLLPVVDPVRGPSGPEPPLSFRPNWGAKGWKIFWGDRPPPPYLRVWMIPPPSQGLDPALTLWRIVSGRNLSEGLNVFR